ncbi:hypothetical protein FRB95_009903 [Tulasnella sp. JGI-2019a]|nr:hypothetical protein FRB93_002600 [Tulasnella sp. JGI-2019a]KAG9025686.1 hypothetical protein FRB95_009903 [Tulasnella sp. JGI-2019a]
MPTPVIINDQRLKPRVAMRMESRNQRTIRAQMEIQKPSPMEEFLCPKPTMACPTVEKGSLAPRLSSLMDWFNVGFECVEAMEDISNCGGCTNLGSGQNCKMIPSALTATCTDGACQVTRCARGFTPDDEEAACVPASQPILSTKIILKTTHSRRSRIPATCI